MNKGIVDDIEKILTIYCSRIFHANIQRDTASEKKLAAVGRANWPAGVQACATQGSF